MRRTQVRRLFRLLSLATILLIVAMLSALTTMHFAVHGREVTVPKFVGLTPAEAQANATAAGLSLDVEQRFYSPDIPPGKIMSQVPQAGTMVRRGWQVRVAESLGARRVQIPDVIGMSGRAAEINIRQRGLEIGRQAVAHIPDVPSDLVVAQSPPPNASGVSVPKISVLVPAPAEAPAFVMPDFVGQPLALVTHDIEQAGLRMGNVTTRAPSGNQPATNPVLPPTETSATMIVGQEPAAGQKVVAGTVVNFEVSR
jgi:beta-lactam-binding protein with PASTA domain